jgi:type VI secretion system secreted protein VgrG
VTGTVSDFEVLVENVEHPVEVIAFRGEEALSAPFRYLIEVAVSPVEDRQDWVGRAMVLAIHRALHDPAGPREIRGVIQSVEDTGILRSSAGERARCTLELVPHAALLRHSRRSRVFQDKGAVNVVSEVLAGWGVPCRMATTEARAAWSYCVQYDESDLDFAGRVLAAEGIAFALGAPSEEGPFAPHAVVLFDAPAGYGSIAAAIPDLTSAAEGSALAGAQETAFDVSRRRALAPVRARQREYDPLVPGAELVGVAEALDAPNFARPAEVYEYLPSPSPRQGEAHARRALAAHRAEVSRVTLRTNARLLSPGARFTIDGEPGALVVEKLVAEGQNPRFSVESPPHVYRATIHAVPADVVPLPPRPGPRLFHGFDTAVVVPRREDPRGVTPDVDALGRVRVAFRWNRDGSGDTPLAWLRVAQSWAGPRFGAQFVPRAGMEVLVGFLGGDVNRPVIVGALANATTPPPFSLPLEVHKSGIVTRAIEGDGYHELSFDDAPGAERVHLRAQRNLEVSVIADATTRVGGSERTIVEGRREHAVHGPAQETYADERAVTVRGRFQASFASEASVTAAAPISVHANAGLTTHVSGDAEEHVLGARRAHVARDERVVVEGDTLHLRRGDTLTVAGTSDAPRSAAIHAHQSALVHGAKLVEISSEAAVRLAVGDSFVLVTKDTVQVSAKKLRFDGETVEIHADKLNAKAKDVARIEGKKAFVISEGAALGLARDARVRGSAVKLGADLDPGDGPAAPETSAPTVIRMVDQDGEPLAGERYVVRLADGTIRTGALDADGRATLRHLEGEAHVEFPDLATWEDG